MIARAGLRVVDLAQPLSPDTAVWPGMDPLSAQTSATYAVDGAFMRNVAFGEHTGTHLDAPAHFAEGGLTVEGIPAGDLVCEAVVIDIRAACAADCDYVLSAADVTAHEDAHGPLPSRAAVLVCTGWGAFVEDRARYVGDLRFPGVSPEAARLLVERGAAGLGIDTLSVDPGISTDLPGAPYDAAGRPLAPRGARQSGAPAAARGAARDRCTAARRRLGRAGAPARAPAGVGSVFRRVGEA